MTKIIKRNPPPHPGRYIKDAIKAKNSTITITAEALGVHRVTLTRIVNGKHPVTAKTAFLFERWLCGGLTATFLLSLQNEYDLWELAQAYPADSEKAQQHNHSAT